MPRTLAATGSLLLLVLLTHCAASTEDSTAPAADQSMDAKSSSMSTVIHSKYGVTMFGGPGDYQNMSCGLSSRAAQTSQPYYAASSQRYGCKVHLKLTNAAGKCVVVATEDAGPAAWVEAKAGTPILDLSPTALKKLFPSAGELGWSDLRQSPGKYEITAVKTSLPLGPCDAGGGSDGSSGADGSGDGSSGAGSDG